MGYQDPGESRGDGREGGRRRSPYQARGRGMDRQEGNRGRDALGRQSFGAKSSGARGSQAAADALRKRQKANKAALTKRHAMYKSRTRLLHDFEERKAAANDVYVAPELPNILAKDEQSNGGKEAARKEECCEADDSPEKRTNNPATLSTHPEVDEKERKSRSRKHETDNVPCDNDGEAYGTESKFVVDGVPLSRGGVSQVARTGSSSKKALPVSAEGKISKSRKYMPFQKELDIAAARQRQIVRCLV